MYDDIQDTFASMASIVDWVGDNAQKNGMVEAAGPGHYNDPEYVNSANARGQNI